MDTPSETLAAKIMERLVRENLITAEVAKRLHPKLAEGKLAPEDWRLAIELADRKEASP
ncbi:MAG TPA: hypothetical protein VMU04_18500 [Candidatus Acidoferrum sp.]|nr:hypothetical protein [Candidatus Acidoferrum sp.]